MTCASFQADGSVVVWEEVQNSSVWAGVISSVTVSRNLEVISSGPQALLGSEQ